MLPLYLLYICKDVGEPQPPYFGYILLASLCRNMEEQEPTAEDLQVQESADTT